MENQIKNFFDYLFYIGVTSEETSSIIIQLLTSKYNNFNLQSNSIDDLMIALICDYLKLLKQQQLTLIGKNIYEQFLKNKNKTKLKYLQKLLRFKYHFLKKKIKKYFHKWRLKTINLTTINTNNKNKKNNDILYSSFDSSSSMNMDNFINKLDYYNDKKNKKIQQLYDLSETNILNHCTFSPNISPHESVDLSKKRNSNKEKTYIFLYNDYKNRIIKKEELAKKYYGGTSFSPKINKNNKYYNDIKDNFYERYKQWINRKKELENFKNNNLNNNSPILNKSSKRSSFYNKNN